MSSTRQDRTPDVVEYRAFTWKGRGGNPAGVVLDASELTETDMLALARELGHSETAFLIPRGDDAVAVRYFGPAGEVDFCGHATIAAAVAYGDRHQVDEITFETRVGAVPVSMEVRDGARAAVLTTVAPRTRSLGQATVDELLECLGYPVAALASGFPVAAAFAGEWHPIVMVDTRDRLASLDYHLEPLLALMVREGWTTVNVVYRESADLYHSRNAFPVGGVVEDPATGAAAGALGAFLAEHGAVSRPATLQVLQGFDMGVPCSLEVSVPAGAIHGVRVGGFAAPLG